MDLECGTMAVEILEAQQVPMIENPMIVTPLWKLAQERPFWTATFLNTQWEDQCQ
jgi:hypothetical protein